MCYIQRYILAEHCILGSAGWGAAVQPKAVHGAAVAVAVNNHCRDIRLTAVLTGSALNEAVIAAGAADNSYLPAEAVLIDVIEVLRIAGKPRHYPAAGNDSYRNISSINSPASPGKYINYNI
jgi:hypothetical protein